MFRRNFQRVAVLGFGYIGLPTAAVIASRGMKVIGIDTNERVIDTIKSGSIHIEEPDLDGLVQKVVSNGMLIATTRPEPADVFIIAVPTPIDGDKRPDLRSVVAAVSSIVNSLAPGNIVIIESTVPIGTTEKLAKMIVEQRPDLSLGSGGEKTRPYFGRTLPRARFAGTNTHRVSQQ